MIEPARLDAPMTAIDIEPAADDRSMRILEWVLSAVALLVAIALTFLR